MALSDAVKVQNRLHRVSGREGRQRKRDAKHRADLPSRKEEVKIALDRMGGAYRLLNLVSLVGWVARHP